MNPSLPNSRPAFRNPQHVTTITCKLAPRRSQTLGCCMAFAEKLTVPTSINNVSTLLLSTGLGEELDPRKLALFPTGNKPACGRDAAQPSVNCQLHRQTVSACSIFRETQDCHKIADDSKVRQWGMLGVFRSIYMSLQDFSTATYQHQLDGSHRGTCEGEASKPCGAPGALAKFCNRSIKQRNSLLAN